jgi:hypothetical protein
VPVGVTGHLSKRPRGQVGPPGPHPAHSSSSLDPGGERWPISTHLAPLFAQLVHLTRPVATCILLGPTRPLQWLACSAAHAANLCCAVVAYSF